MIFNLVMLKMSLEKKNRFSCFNLYLENVLEIFIREKPIYLYKSNSSIYLNQIFLKRCSNNDIILTDNCSDQKVMFMS